MGKTFVYNIATPFTPPADLINLSYGLFFDGTRNNLRNTEIYKKVKGIDEYKNKLATSQETKIYKKNALERKIGNAWLKKRKRRKIATITILPM